jgi:hypothetical protein
MEIGVLVISEERRLRADGMQPEIRYCNSFTLGKRRKIILHLGQRQKNFHSSPSFITMGQIKKKSIPIERVDKTAEK